MRSWRTARPSRVEWVLLATAALAVVAVAASASAADEGVADVATVRILHLSPDAPFVDVLIDGRPVVRDLEFIHRSHAFVLPSGRHEVRVFPHRPPQRQLTAALEDGVPADPGAPAPRRRAQPLEPVVAVFDLPPGTVTTLVLTGFYTPRTAEERRGHVSITVTPPDAEIRLEGPHGYRATFEGDQFLVGLEPGPYQAEVRRSGYGTAVYGIEVAPDTTSVVSITLQEVDRSEEDATAPEELVPDTPHTVQEAAWRALELQPYQDDRVPLAPPGHALVRFVHVAPTVAALDVRGWPAAEGADEKADEASEPDRGGQELLGVDGLTFPNASGYRPAPARAMRLELRVAGTAAVVLAIEDLELAPGATYTVFVSADPLTNTVWLVPVVDAVVPQAWGSRGAAP